LPACVKQGRPYPNRWRSDHRAEKIHTEFAESDSEQLSEINRYVSVAGRIMAHRVMGKSTFISIQDGSGKIQLFLNRDELGGAEIYNPTKKWDLGDIIGGKGVLFRTRAGELSVRLSHVEMVSKSPASLAGKMAWSE